MWRLYETKFLPYLIDAGFEIDTLESRYIAGTPRFAGCFSCGSARC